jgi:hypothetical protein
LESKCRLFHQVAIMNSAHLCNTLQSQASLGVEGKLMALHERTEKEGHASIMQSDINFLQRLDVVI